MTDYKAILFGRCVRTYSFNEHVFIIGLLVFQITLTVVNRNVNYQKGPLKGDLIIIIRIRNIY